MQHWPALLQNRRLRQSAGATLRDLSDHPSHHGTKQAPRGCTLEDGVARPLREVLVRLESVVPRGSHTRMMAAGPAERHPNRESQAQKAVPQVASQTTGDRHFGALAQ